MMELYTSVAASDAVARRMAREVNKRRDEYLTQLSKIIADFHLDLIQRRKLRRDEVRPTMDRIVKRLSGTANVIDVEVSFATKKQLASNEMVNARLIITHSSSATELFDFITMELLLTRHELRMRFDMMDFTATTHVISRFMQRGRTSPLRFFSGMQKSLSAAAILTPIASHSHRRIAVPHEHGLLLGDIEGMNMREGDDAPPLFPIITCLTNKGKTEEHDPDARPYRAVCRARTFIDGDSLTGHRADLLQALEAWQEEHKNGIMAWWEAVAFGSARVRIGQTQDMIGDSISRARDAATKIVNSGAWNRLGWSEGGGK